MSGNLYNSLHSYFVINLLEYTILGNFKVLIITGFGNVSFIETTMKILEFIEFIKGIKNAELQETMG